MGARAEGDASSCTATSDDSKQLRSKLCFPAAAPLLSGAPPSARTPRPGTQSGSLASGGTAASFALLETLRPLTDAARSEETLEIPSPGGTEAPA